MKRTFELSVAAILAAGGMIYGSPARASFSMILSDSQGDKATVKDNGNGTQTITIHGAVTLSNPGTTAEVTSGSLVFIGTIGKLNVDVSTGQVDANTPFIKSLNLDTIDHIGAKGAARVMSITLTETGLQLRSALHAEHLPFSLATAGTLNDKGDKWQATGVVDTTNAGRTSGAGVYTVSSPVFTGKGAFSFSTDKPIILTGGPPLTNKFSLSVVNSITVAAQGTLSGNSIVSLAVPEPCTLAIFAGGLPLAGIAAIRRRRTKARAA